MASLRGWHYRRDLKKWRRGDMLTRGKCGPGRRRRRCKDWRQNMLGVIEASREAVSYGSGQRRNHGRRNRATLFWASWLWEELGFLFTMWWDVTREFCARECNDLIYILKWFPWLLWGNWRRQEYKQRKQDAIARKHRDEGTSCADGEKWWDRFWRQNRFRTCWGKRCEV